MRAAQLNTLTLREARDGSTVSHVIADIIALHGNALAGTVETQFDVYLLVSGNHISRSGSSSTDQCTVNRKNAVKGVSQRNRTGNIRSDKVALQFASFTANDDTVGIT